MWTINNCSIVSTTPTYRQQSITGSTTICRTYKPKFIYGNKNLKAERWKQEWYKAELCLQRSSITIWPTSHQRLIKHADDITIYTSGPVVADLINGLNIYLRKCTTTSTKKTDSVNGKIYSNIFYTRFPRASNTSWSEAGWPNTIAGKEAKSVRIDGRHPAHFHTTLQHIAVTMQQHNNVSKALAGFTWGCDKETLLSIYHAIGRSILSYCWLSGRLHIRTLTWAGSNGLKIMRWELPLTVIKWQMSPNCIKRLGNYQFASSSPLHAIYHNIPAISSAADRQMTGRNDDDHWSAGLNLTSSNTLP